MGHIQRMTNEQRIRFLSEKYKADKESRRGKGVSYLNDKSMESLIKKGYAIYLIDNKKNETNFLHKAQEIVAELRGMGNFARIIVNPCHMIKGAQTYSVYYRSKNNTHQP